MELTPEQKAEIEQQRSDDPQRRHFMLEITPQQQTEWERAVAEEMAYKDENIRRGRAWLRALREDSFSGELRRAIVASKRPADELAEKINLDPRVLAEFRAGEASLPSDAIDRLIHELRLTVAVQAESTE
jgi:hypothetical protein